MANKKIIELASLNSASLQSQDLMIVEDVSYSETKNITIQSFLQYLEKNIKVIKKKKK